MTYYAIHEDGRKYGPATVEQLRQWVAEGRIGPATAIEDETGARKPLSEMPGFEDVVAPPPQAMASPSAPTYSPSAPARSSGAIWVVAAVVGCGAVILMIAVLSAILFPVFAQAKLAAKRTATLANAKQVALGVLMYTADNDGLLPPKMSNSDDLRRSTLMYTKSDSFYVTLNPAGGEFLGNGEIAGAATAEARDPLLIPMIYESRPWPNDKRAVAWLDGHASMELNFNPATDLKTIEGK